MDEKISDLHEFRRWVRVRLAQEELTHKAYAKKLGIAEPRISDAIHGRIKGRKHIPAIIEGLGGNPENFEDFLKGV